ncbi:hypothetical protein [Methylobacterium sp. J-076]|nr:hypothetical protein [Methylobacterium sp. J-076]MCJ2014685.1 hypothetical protein [Methylobacterium sp. J-076]
MLTIRRMRVFAHWLAGLRDVWAKARVDARLRRLSLGSTRCSRAGVAN